MVLSLHSSGIEVTISMNSHIWKHVIPIQGILCQCFQKNYMHMSLLVTVYTVHNPLIPSFHSLFCSGHEHRLLQQHFVHIGLGRLLLLGASVEVGSFSSHLVSGQSRIHKAGRYALSKMCQVLGFYRFLMVQGQKHSKLFFSLAGPSWHLPRAHWVLQQDLTSRLSGLPFIQGDLIV